MKKINPYIIEKLSIIDTASDGRGIAKKDTQVIFVEGGIPGDIVDIEILSKEKKFLVGKIHLMLTPSPDRVDHLCKHFGICGGCKWQYMAYPAQLFYKQKQVKDSFERIGKLPVDKMLPILGSDEIYYYRNKLDFAASNKRWLTSEEIKTQDTFEQNVLGFHVPKYFDKVVDIDRCHLQSDIINLIRNEIRTIARNENHTFYDAKTHIGFLRNVVFRTSLYKNQLMVIFIYGEENQGLKRIYVEQLKIKFPQITSFISILNTKLNDSYTDLSYQVEYGVDHITEKIGNYIFKISPLSFFQTNSAQTQRLYQTVFDFLPEKSEHIYDLYCGTGSIGIYVSSKAEKITGIEYIDSAVKDAFINAELNDIKKAKFCSGDIAKVLNPEFLIMNGKPDTIIIDPPRAGMDVKVVNSILDINANDIVYVSCNPATQARDLALMYPFYEIIKIQPVDMFPHTTHVENVVKLKLRETETK